MTSGEPSGLRPALLTAAGIGIALALVTSWPLPARLASSMPESGHPTEIGDPYLVSWQIAWEGHALKTDPSHLFDANYFYPLKNTLAFLDPVHGYAPAAFIGSGSDAAVIRYNLLHLFAKALAFAGAFLLARELGLGTFPSILAGGAFAYAPWRLDQLGHLLVISSGGIPLALFMLVRGYRRSSARWILAGWCAATWQLSIGYTLGLQFAYLLGLIGLMLLTKWSFVGVPEISKAVLRASVVGVVFFLGWGVMQAIPNLRVAETYPEAVRSDQELGFYSPPPRAFRAASSDNLFWGDRSAATRTTLTYPFEQTLFPGLIAVSLAAIGVLYVSSPLALRAGLLAGVLLSAYLALGLEAPDGGLVYRTLLNHAPGWRGIRTPGRLMTTATLFLALLAALGLQHVYARLRNRFSATRLNALPAIIAAVLAVLVVLEGWGPARILPVTSVPASQVQAQGPIAHIPMDDGSDRLYMFWSTENFAPMVNGVAGFTPQPHTVTSSMVNSFPDQASVTYLRDAGIRSVIVHLARLPAEWELAEAPRAAELGLEVQRIGTDLVYSLTP